MRRTLRTPATLAITLAALVAPPTAPAQIAVEHDSTVVTELSGNANGVPEPGESVGITEHVLSSEFTPLTGVTGVLSASAASVTVSRGEAAWPDLAFGTPAGNLVPFAVNLGADAPCGARLPFDLALTTSGGAATTSLSVLTGAGGPFASWDSTDVPVAVPDRGSAVSTLTVGAAGYARGIRVRIGLISHSYTGDLRVELVASDGRSVVLVGGRGGSGQNFAGTVFDDSATAPIRSGVAPFTGTFAPEQPLSALDGTPLAGTWSLRVTDANFGGAAGIESWGLDLAPAVCKDPAAPPPDPQPQPWAPPGPLHRSDSARGTWPQPPSSVNSRHRR